MDTTTQDLKNKEVILLDTTEKLEENKELVRVHQVTEKTFHQEADVLLDTIQNSVADIGGLASKIGNIPCNQ